MWLKTLQQAKRVIKIVVGFTVLLAGVVMLVTPGPGWVVIALGLAILAAEYVWARRLLDHLKHHGVKLRDAVFNSNSDSKRPRFIWARRLLERLKEWVTKMRGAPISSGGPKNSAGPPANLPK